MTTDATAGAPPDASMRNRYRRQPVGFILALPALIFLAAFLVYPVLNLLYLSFHEYSPLRSPG